MTANADFRDRNLASAAQQAAAQARAYTPPTLLQPQYDAEAQVRHLTQRLTEALAERDFFTAALLQEQRESEAKDARIAALKATVRRLDLELVETECQLNQEREAS